MKQIFIIFLYLSMITVGLKANPVTVSFETIDSSRLPVEVEKIEETDEEIATTINTETASLFNSTYTVVFVALVGVYLLLIRKRESRGMNL